MESGEKPTPSSTGAEFGKQVAELAAGQKAGGGRYTLIKFLGKGGMGIVWLARDEHLRDDVALKFLPAEIHHDVEALDDMRRETLKSRKLSHPNIIRIHDLHVSPDESPFISMEYIAGAPLNVLKAKQPQRFFTWEYLKPIIKQLCAALDYAHQQKVIHRDLKPANMMLTTDGVLKLADFGIAAVVSDSMSRVSLKHSTSGTVVYMSPQQMNGQRPTPSDDIYALGATIYELLTSKPPFYTGDVLHQVQNIEPQPLAERLADMGLTNEIPPDVSALVMACLSKDPPQRPQSAGAVAEWIGLELGTEKRSGGLALHVSGRPPAEEPAEEAEMAVPEFEEPAGTKRKTGLWIGLGLAALLVVGAVGWLVFGKKPPSTVANAAPSSTKTTVANPAPIPTQTLDLLALIDLTKDRVNVPPFTGLNNWSRDPSGSLVYHTDGNAGKIVPPVAIDARTYEFEITFQRKDAAGQLHIDLPIDGVPTTVPIILDMPGQLFLNNKAGTAWPSGLPTGGRVLVRCEAATAGQSRVTVAFDGKTIGEWTGNLRDYGKKGEPHPAFPGQIVSSLSCRRDSYEIKALVLRIFDGSAKLLRPSAQSGTAPKVSGVSSGPTTKSGGATSNVGFLPLFNGKTLSGWTTDKPAQWQINNGVVQGIGPRVHLTSPGSYTNLEFKAEVMAGPNSNGGLYFRVSGTRQGGLLDGYEAQVENNNTTTKTGSLYKIQDIAEALVSDGVWFKLHVVAVGNRIVILVNDKITVDFTDPDRRYVSGRLALQSMVQGTTVSYRNVMVKSLPADENAAWAEVSRERPALTPVAAASSVTKAPTSAQTMVPASSGEAGFLSLFNGRDLSGWKVPNPNPFWAVTNGVIVGHQNEARTLFTLATEALFLDFHFELEFKMTGEMDSGVILRGGDEWQCQIGYSITQQRDMTASLWSGRRYVAESTEGSKLVKKGQWNKLRIRAEGPHFTIWINDGLALDYTNTAHAIAGPIALQNVTGTAGGTVEFRNIRVLRLDSAPPASTNNPASQPSAKSGNATRPQTESIDLGGGVTMEFVLIPAGSFMMGSDSGESDEKPAHKDTLTKPFYLGKFEVTQEQWQTVIGSNPSRFKGPKLPVTGVSWDDCQSFLAKLQEKTRRKFTLPTEAQWEYACRAGTTTRYSFGDSDANLGDYAWFPSNSGGSTHPVGSKKPNPWGLYDMHGSALEWCADWYGAYASGEAIDPQGVSSGNTRVLRGGSWGNDSPNLRATKRVNNDPGYRKYNFGFRCVMGEAVP